MTKSYTTKQGDTWDYIAYTHYGDERMMHELINANYEYKLTSVFSAGVTLVLPDLEDKIAVSMKPPWMQ